MIENAFVETRGLLKAGHAAHPQCSADYSRTSVEANSLTPAHDPDHQIRGALLRFAYVYAVLLFALPVVLLFVFMDPIYWWWFDQFRRPAVEQQLGFKTEVREISVPSGERWRRLVISDVVPGGRFDRAGVQSGDIVACMHHGDPDFWSRLLIVLAGYESEIRLLSAGDLLRGCEASRRIRFEGRSIQRRSDPQTAWGAR